MTKYLCSIHSHYDHTIIEADSPRDAAENYVDSGSWPDSSATQFFLICVGYADDTNEKLWRWQIAIKKHPPEPPCTAGHEHDWRTPSFANGVEVCKWCANYMISEEATDWETGQSYISYYYDSPDEDSLSWANLFIDQSD